MNRCTGRVNVGTGSEEACSVIRSYRGVPEAGIIATTQIFILWVSFKWIVIYNLPWVNDPSMGKLDVRSIHFLRMDVRLVFSTGYSTLHN